MSRKANYFKIGVFVIAAFTLLIAAVIVFGAGLFDKERLYFETYFDSSVSGLSIGAPMEFRGVRMGRVEKITFARNEYEMPATENSYYKYANRIIVLVSVDQDNLSEMTLDERRESIKQMTARGFRLRLAPNILTGHAFLEGDYLDPNRHPVLEVPWEPKHFYVSSAPGEFSTMKNSIDKILERLEKVDTDQIGELIGELLVSVNRAVDDANVPAVSAEIQKLLANASQAIDNVNLPAIGNEAQSLLAEARNTNQHLKELLKKPDQVSEMANIAVAIDQFNKILQRIDRLVLTQSPQIEQTLDHLQEISANLKEATESFKKYPSQLIFSQPPPKSEVSK